MSLRHSLTVLSLCVWAAACADKPPVSAPATELGHAAHLHNPMSAAALREFTPAPELAPVPGGPRTSDVAAPGILYATGNDGTTLIAIDPSTGTWTTIGSSGYSMTWAAAFTSDGTLWTLVNGFGNSQLAKFNLATGAATPVGGPTGIQAIALEVDAAGTMYTIGYNDQRLYRVNTTTGALTLVGYTGLVAVMDMAFDASGTLWVVDGYNRLNKVNPTTGAATFVANLTAPAVMGIAVASDGTVYVTSYTYPANLYKLNTTTGVATLASSTTSTHHPHGGDFLGGDNTPPVITPTVTGTLGDNGWYTSNVSVTWSVVDNESAITSSAGCGASSVTTDTNGATFTCTATSAGGTASQSVTVKRDATDPTVAYSGNTGSYTVDQSVNITCAAADNLSGVASSTCADVAGDAYTFSLGTNTYSASATDNAGNTGSASTSFTVSVTTGSLCALTERFVSKAGVANSLCAKLRAADASLGRGNATAAANQVDAYMNEVRAQAGKSMTNANAAILLALADALM